MPSSKGLADNFYPFNRRILCMARKISAETTRRVAQLARLALSPVELKRAQRELNEILSAFKIMDEVKTNVQPSFHPMPVVNVTREDRIESPLGQEKALAQTKHKHEGYFKGPRVV